MKKILLAIALCCFTHKVSEAQNVVNYGYGPIVQYSVPIVYPRPVVTYSSVVVYQPVQVLVPVVQQVPVTLYYNPVPVVPVTPRNYWFCPNLYRPIYYGQ